MQTLLMTVCLDPALRQGCEVPDAPVPNISQTMLDHSINQAGMNVLQPLYILQCGQSLLEHKPGYSLSHLNMSFYHGHMDWVCTLLHS